MNLQSIQKTSYFNRLAALPFRKLLIFNGLRLTAFKERFLICGTDFRLFALTVHGYRVLSPGQTLAGIVATAVLSETH